MSQRNGETRVVSLAAVCYRSSYLGEDLEMDLADVEFSVWVQTLQCDALSLQNRLGWPFNEQSGCMWTENRDAGYCFLTWKGRELRSEGALACTEESYRCPWQHFKNNPSLWQKFISGSCWKTANTLKVTVVTWQANRFLLAPLKIVAQQKQFQFNFVWTGHKNIYLFFSSAPL